MAPSTPEPLIVITGPTASGKSSLALKLAKEYDGEIICADSRTIYTGMDIGTAKPTVQERKEVKHHLLDVIEPNQVFTAADFQRLAFKAIAEIRQRNKIPFLVGGTGLYVDSVVFNYQFGVQADQALRSKLGSLTIQELWDCCEKNKIPLPENRNNKRYVIRAIERHGIDVSRSKKPIKDCFIVGISTERADLRNKIATRVDTIFSSGVIDEAARLAKHYGWDSEAMTANVYRLARKVIEGNISESEAKQQFVTLDWRLAKRQLTWLKRNTYVHWYDLPTAYQRISEFLESRHIK